ncbi:metallophosphoesterase family protein [candidate division WOR-3 bacterium]|nr:metallophosphoesterase family protein [candidate division WOR-3 bacterium]
MRIALFADYHGGDRVWPLLEEALEDQRVDLIAFAGDVLDSEEREAEWQKAYKDGKVPEKKTVEGEENGVIDELTYREFFINLTGFGVPVVFVPGHLDAPTSRLDEAVKGFNEVYNVQNKTVEIAGYTFLGWGGSVGPANFDKNFYCSKASTFKKHLASSLNSDPAQTILLVHNPPVSKVALQTNDENQLGAEVINEIIEQNQPAFCLCGHAHSSPGQDTIGSTIVVNPGAMFRGRYAIIEVEHHRVLFPTPLKM